MRRQAHVLLPVSIVTAALAFAAAGCGGKSAEEKWANDACTPVLNWDRQIKGIVDDAKSVIATPTPGTLQTLKTDASKAVTATKRLVSDLGSLPPAPGENGAVAKRALTLFASQMSRTVSSLKRAVDAVSSSANLTQATKALAGAAGQVSSFDTRAKSTVAAVGLTSTKLKSGFEKAGACKELTGS